MKPLPDPFWAAQMMPVAPYTRSVHILLPWNQAESGRYTIQWNWSVDIVGVLFTIIQGSDNGQGQAFLVPQHADFVASLNVSNEKQYTSNADDSDITAQADFCDLRALDVVAGFRVTRIIIAGPGELGVNVRWKRVQPAGGQRTLDALISMSVYHRRCSLEEAREAISRMTEYSR